VPESLKITLADAPATEALGQRLAAALLPLPGAGCTVWLRGELGAGKTTLARALLRGLGHSGRVPSPTYTLVEPYDLAACRVHHVDLYRLQDPAEAEFLGLTELPAAAGLLLVEWPERGAGRIPAADLEVHLEVEGQGRVARLAAGTPAGAAALRRLGKV
jgi:tRNA threonylcarbamoyladenosine biosynthesis protein TsaE